MVDNQKVSTNRKKNRILVFFSIIIIIGVCVGSYFYLQSTHYITTDNAKVDTKICEVAAGKSGTVGSIRVSVGDYVTAGEVLGWVQGGAHIESPINGTVIDISANKFDLVSATDDIFVVAGTDDMYITANIEETNIEKIAEGQDVKISLDAYDGKTFDGYVDSIDQYTSTELSGSATSFTTTGTYTKVTQLIPVKIKLDDNTVDLSTIIGTNATVKIKVK